MSRLNRAFIKAYNRDDSPSLNVVDDAPPVNDWEGSEEPAAFLLQSTAEVREVRDTEGGDPGRSRGLPWDDDSSPYRASPYRADDAARTESPSVDKFEADLPSPPPESTPRPWELPTLNEGEATHWTTISSAKSSLSERASDAFAVANPPWVDDMLRYDTPHADIRHNEPLPETGSAPPPSIINAIPSIPWAMPVRESMETPGFADDRESSAVLEPALQVDRFHWPKICITLNERVDAGVALLVDELFAGADAGRKLLAVTSYRRGEGQTTLVLCTARALAARGARVALVDAADSPKLAVRLGVSPEAGWHESRRRGLPLDEALIESSIDGVTLLPASSHGDQSPRFDFPTVRRDLERLREAYDFVLVDASPFDSDSELFERAPFDGAILVHDVSTSSFVNPSITDRHLAKVQIGWWRIVENFVSPRKLRS
jgi:Mrp family chromosome partitioning ATPase